MALDSELVSENEICLNLVFQHFALFFLLIDSQSCVRLSCEFDYFVQSVRLMAVLVSN